MKKFILPVAIAAMLTPAALAKGTFETHDMGTFTLHIYNSNDVMADASFIIEGRDSLVTMEYPLFKENAREFDAYIAQLGKPVAQVITDYHEGSSGNLPQAMAQGMPAFMKGDIYGSMMAGFKQAFGDSMTDLPTGTATEIPFGTTITRAGVTFTFLPGATSDFPAASILIGGKVYYTHWAPAKAHVSHLQVSSPAAIDAEIAEAEESLQSGAVLFIGGHGGAATAEDVTFKIEYLRHMQQLLSQCPSAEGFVAALKEAYPGLPGEDWLDALAAALYKK